MIKSILSITYIVCTFYYTDCAYIYRVLIHLMTAHICIDYTYIYRLRIYLLTAHISIDCTYIY